MLEKLAVVVCMGNDARYGWDKIFPENQCQKGWGEIQAERNPIVLCCPHPGYQSINQTRNIEDGLTPYQRIIRTLKQAKRILEQ